MLPDHPPTQGVREAQDEQSRVSSQLSSTRRACEPRGLRKGQIQKAHSREHNPIQPGPRPAPSCLAPPINTGAANPNRPLLPAFHTAGPRAWKPPDQQKRTVLHPSSRQVCFRPGVVSLPPSPLLTNWSGALCCSFVIHDVSNLFKSLPRSPPGRLSRVFAANTDQNRTVVPVPWHTEDAKKKKGGGLQENKSVAGPTGCANSEFSAEMRGGPPSTLTPGAPIAKSGLALFS